MKKVDKKKYKLKQLHPNWALWRQMPCWFRSLHFGHPRRLKNVSNFSHDKKSLCLVLLNLYGSQIKCFKIIQFDAFTVLNSQTWERRMEGGKRRGCLVGHGKDFPALSHFFCVLWVCKGALNGSPFLQSPFHASRGDWFSVNFSRSWKGHFSENT